MLTALLRKYILLCVLLGGSLACTGFGPPVLAEGRPDGLRLFPEHVAAAYRLAHPPAVSAKAALAVDVDANQVLYSLRPNEPLPPASTVKLMTALVTVQRADPDALVTVSSRAADMSGSRMGLVAAESLTVRDLLYGLLLPSGNDAAVALAEHVSGSEEAFVRVMNEMAASLRLKGTLFANSHGLDDPAQTTSAADLVILARAVFDYPLLGKIVASQTAQVGSRALTNTNQLLGSYRGADGMKTGTSDLAGECLVASVTREGHRLLVVILGSQDRYADVQLVLDYVAAGWQWRRVAPVENASAWVTTISNARSYRLRAPERAELFLPRWQWTLVRPALALDAAAPLTGTLPVGTLTLTFAGQPLTSVPLTVWQSP